jgi:IclR family transcriptional regulator, KDG regulon repressor
MLLTVENVGRILDLYDAGAPEWGPTDVGAQLGVGKSKAQALMASMAEIGLLRRVERGRYRIGWRGLSLGELVARSTPFRPLAHRMAERVARATGETVHVGALDAGRVVYVDRVLGVKGVMPPSSAAHCSGVGKVLLAHLDPGEIDAVLDRHGLPGFTAHTITDRDALYAELHRVRRDGVAYDREEVQEGLSCVAAPIRDPHGAVVAAMSISSPTDRFAAAFASVVTRATDAVTTALREPSQIPGPALRSVPSGA